MESRMNNVVIHICATKMSDDRHKSYQTTTMKNIIKNINGLFNSNGGKLRLQFDTSPPDGHIKESIRKIEQRINTFTDELTLVYNVIIVKKPTWMEVVVKRSHTDDIFTLNYNFCLPTHEQVIEVSSNVAVTKIRDILNMNIPYPDPVQPDCHCKEFRLGKEAGVQESKRVQLKLVTTRKQTKNVNLAQRFIKNCKLLWYVSAYANYAGGNVYFGIDDNGIVRGEQLTPQDQAVLQEEFCEAIRGMKWPENCNANGEKKLWEIHFEPVKNGSGEIVPSTYVIVIYVAQCPGGVFMKEPECYEIEKNEAKQIDFPTWKKLILQEEKRESDESENATNVNNASYVFVYQMLTELLNENCEWSDLKKATDNAETRHNEADVRLICCSKLIKFCLRKCDYKTAEEMFEDYKKILSESASLEVFQLMEQYLRCLMERSKGNFQKSYEIAEKCFQKLGEIAPSIISVAFYVLAATVVNILATIKENPSERNDFLAKAKELYDTAERHLQNVHRCESAKADLRQKIYTNKSILFSGSSLAGLTPANVDSPIINEDEAQNYLDKTQRIVNHDKYPLSEFRDIQFKFAQADLFYLASKKDKTRSDLQGKALKFAKRAEQSAKNAELSEMERYAKNRVDLIQKEIYNCA